MRIDVKMVEVETKTSKTGKPYHVCEVTYKNDHGETKSYRHFDFVNPAMFKALSALSKGDVVDVQTVKNEKGYPVWVEIGKGSTEPPEEKVAGGKPRTFVPDEEKQKLIVRQSCLSNALKFADLHKEVGSTLGDIFEFAGTMEQFVYGTLPTMPADIEEDIPY